MRRSYHRYGPGAGIYGGELVAQGNVEEIKACPQSLTGQYLRHEENRGAKTQTGG